MLTIGDDLVQDYVAECREHLATIEQDLLAIEENGDRINEELVNRVFRAAHSIKGGAGFFELVKIRELAHKTENVLDLIRSRQIRPTPESVSILLMAFDKLRELIDHHAESNHADIAEFVTALAALATATLPDERKGSIDEPVLLPTHGIQLDVSAFDLDQARRGGKCVYWIDYDLMQDVHTKDNNPLEIFRSLSSCGTIIEVVFDLASAGTLEQNATERLAVGVLYATALEPDMVGHLVDVPSDRLRLVETNGQVRPLNSLVEPPVAPAQGAKVSTDVRTETARAAVEETSSLPSAEVCTTPPVAEAPVRATQTKAPPVAAIPAEATIRLNVKLLDSLMTLAGELVLSRNQLNESLAHQEERGVRTGAQRISLVTSELQEVVTQTRMQPAGSLFSKFPRVVRDLARDMGKSVRLKIEGGDVEIDKSILEGLSDPLTHMVRNSVDHGIELASDRIAQGKSAEGEIVLRASHQAGQVMIEIADDGKGISAQKVAASALAKGLVSHEQVLAMSPAEKIALILLPGVSSAEKLTDLSGRGVGMDVVKTNLDKLGGKVEIESEQGKGTRFRIKLPLTLAIIPSLLVSDAGDRFALPQVNVSELIRIPAAALQQRIERVGDAEVVKLRDRLLPLIRLSDAIGCPRESQLDRALNVVLVNTGTFEYGLAVEELHDTVEIVVKPLGRHFKALHEYAGATILGDGRVAVILDVAGLASRAGLSSAAADRVAHKQMSAKLDDSGEVHSLLLFHNAPGELCAVPIEEVKRIERVRPAQVESLGGRRILRYRGANIPLVALSDSAAVGMLEESQRWVVIVFEERGKTVGLVAAEPLDMVEVRLDIDTATLRQTGIAGSAVLKDQTVLMLDIPELTAPVLPENSLSHGVDRDSAVTASGTQLTVLLAEDSDFFRGQIQRLLESAGYRVLAAADGLAAWEILDSEACPVDLIATDIEMPRMDGLAFTRKVREDARFTALPVIALSSLAGDEEIARGRAAGANDYLVKLSKDELLESIRRNVRKHDPAPYAHHGAEV
jgi:two-component system chemotaxis sensor kinase CheA